MTILVVGSTGTLGRQIVHELIKAGYSVRCLVRNIRKANFLREWGAELVYGDLSLPETIPNTLKGMSIVIDVSTLRPEEEIATLQQIDLIGKIALIKASKVAKIKNFLFFSITNNEKYQSIPLMRLKCKIEKILISSNLPYQIFQISGFYQGIISQYAIPILEQQTISTTHDSSSISYIDTRDIAQICTKTLIHWSKLNFDNSNRVNLELGRVWNSNEIIKLCEDLSGQSAKLSFTPLILLGVIKNLMSFSKWTWDIHDRLAFSQLLSIQKLSVLESINSSTHTFMQNPLLNFDKFKFITLESYLEDYFENMLTKLRDLNYDQNKMIKHKDLTF